MDSIRPECLAIVGLGFQALSIIPSGIAIFWVEQPRIEGDRGPLFDIEVHVSRRDVALWAVSVALVAGGVFLQILAILRTTNSTPA